MSFRQARHGIVAAGLMFAATAQADLVVIANSRFSGDSAAIEEIKRIYLGKSKSLSGGAKVKPVDQRRGSGRRSEFLKLVIEKNESQLKSYWSRLIFSGKGKPPVALQNDDAVKVWVSSNTDGIGYVDASQVDDSIKILLRLP